MASARVETRFPAKGHSSRGSRMTEALALAEYRAAHG